MLFATAKVRNFVVQVLKIYDQAPVVGSSRLGGEYGCREKNAAESLAVGGRHCTAVAAEAADYGSIGFEGHLARDSCFVDKVEIGCALTCRRSS